MNTNKLQKCAVPELNSVLSVIRNSFSFDVVNIPNKGANQGLVPSSSPLNTPAVVLTLSLPFDGLPRRQVWFRHNASELRFKLDYPCVTLRELNDCVTPGKFSHDWTTWLPIILLREQVAYSARLFCKQQLFSVEVSLLLYFTVRSPHFILVHEPGRKRSWSARYFYARFFEFWGH